MRRSFKILAGAASAVALLPASSAFAGQYTLGGDPAHGGNRLSYSDRSAQPGEANNVTFSRVGSDVVIRDTGAPVTQAIDAVTLQPKGFTCPQIDANAVACPAVRGGQAIVFLDVNTGWGNDTVVNDTDIASALNGERDADTLTGGSAADTLNGDGGIDTLDGRGGDDLIETDGHTATSGGEADSVTCGPGNDRANIDRRDNVDLVPAPYNVNFNPKSPTSCETVYFEGTLVGATPNPGTPPPPPVTPGSGPPASKPPVQVSTGTVAVPKDSPAPLGRCKRSFVGTALADNFVGDDSGDRMVGRAGNDSMFGFGGDDCIYGERGNDRIDGGAGNDLVVGGPGRDSVSGGIGNDRVYGQAGNDKLYGYAGNDRIVGGPGFDRIYGGSGRDIINSRDGRRDRVNCGPGRDTVRADRADKLIGCERKIRR